jgi:hypothetical protein
LQLGDQDVANTEQDSKSKDPGLRTQRAGRAHFIGVLDVIGGGQTNAVLIPLGRMTFRKQLEDISVP